MSQGNDISFVDHFIKEHIIKINPKLKLLYRQSRYLTPELKRVVSNSPIQPHFDYGCTLWMPFSYENLKNKLEDCKLKLKCC